MCVLFRAPDVALRDLYGLWQRLGVPSLASRGNPVEGIVGGTR